ATVGVLDQPGAVIAGQVLAHRLVVEIAERDQLAVVELAHLRLVDRPAPVPGDERNRRQHDQGNQPSQHPFPSPAVPLYGDTSVAAPPPVDRYRKVRPGTARASLPCNGGKSSKPATSAVVRSRSARPTADGASLLRGPGLPRGGFARFAGRLFLFHLVLVVVPLDREEHRDAQHHDLEHDEDHGEPVCRHGVQPLMRIRKTPAARRHVPATTTATSSLPASILQRPRTRLARDHHRRSPAPPACPKATGPTHMIAPQHARWPTAAPGLRGLHATTAMGPHWISRRRRPIEINGLLVASPAPRVRPPFTNHPTSPRLQ